MLILPAVFESFRSLKDRSYKLTFETQELTPEQLTGLGHSLNYPGFLAFNKDVFKKEQTDILKTPVDYEDTGKSKAQRLRAVLFVYWKQNNQGYEDFELFYSFHMEKIISHFKDKLLPDYENNETR